MNENSTSIVVDASVAKAAGLSEKPSSRMCREFLMAVKDSNHKVLMSSKLRNEWDVHQSRFTFYWRSSMIAKKRLVLVKDIENSIIRSNIDKVSYSKNQREAVLKDLHLIEVAILYDKIVVSSDKAVRKLFCVLGNEMKALKKIIWVDPNNSDENAVDWVKGGCKKEFMRTLDNFTLAEVAIAAPEVGTKKNRGSHKK